LIVECILSCSGVLSSPRELSRCSRAPEMERVDYWKMKSQVVVAESAGDTYPPGRCSAAGWIRPGVNTADISPAP
jgi:hypothetical protein